MLDVSGDESGYFVSGRAVCVDQQSKFRRAARAWGTDASGESDDGGGGGYRGAFHRYSELGVSVIAGAKAPNSKDA